MDETSTTAFAARASAPGRGNLDGQSNSSTAFDFFLSRFRPQWQPPGEDRQSDRTDCDTSKVKIVPDNEGSKEEKNKKVNAPFQLSRKKTVQVRSATPS
jgi:hypothetical protein